MKTIFMSLKELYLSYLYFKKGKPRKKKLFRGKQHEDGH
jgi:hypothetical protein